MDQGPSTRSSTRSSKIGMNRMNAREHVLPFVHGSKQAQAKNTTFVSHFFFHLFLFPPYIKHTICSYESFNDAQNEFTNEIKNEWEKRRAERVIRKWKMMKISVKFSQSVTVTQSVRHSDSFE